MTPLIMAAHRNCFAIVKQLLDMGESIEKPHSPTYVRMLFWLESGISMIKPTTVAINRETAKFLHWMQTCKDLKRQINLLLARFRVSLLITSGGT